MGEELEEILSFKESFKVKDLYKPWNVLFGDDKRLPKLSSTYVVVHSVVYFLPIIIPLGYKVVKETVNHSPPLIMLTPCICFLEGLL